MDEQFDGRGMLSRCERLQELLGRDGSACYERVIFEKTVQALARNSGADSAQLRHVVWHAKSVEEGLETVVEVAPMLHDRSRPFASKEEDVKGTGEFMRSVDDRYEMKSAEHHGKVHHFEWAWHFDLAPLQDTVWQRLRSRLLKQRLLLAQFLELKMDGAADLMLLLDATIGPERSTVPKDEIH